MKSIEMEICSCFICSLRKPTHKHYRSRKSQSVKDRRRNGPNISRLLIIGLVALSVMVGGCTYRYHPTEYVIDEDRIAGLPIGAPVRIIGEPSSTDEQVVWHIPVHTIVTNYNEVTTALVAQLTKEMTKRGQPVSDSASKTIRVKVLGLGVINNESMMMLLLQLGAEQPKELLINETDGNLDGAIANAVIQILSDQNVRAFLGNMPAGNPG